MADLPILMSGPMNRAVLREIEAPGTGKTQTRRITSVKPLADLPSEHQEELELQGWDVFGDVMAKPRFSPGDRVWVRETWRVGETFDTIPPRFLIPSTRRHPARLHYEADGIAPAPFGKIRPGIHMTRWASRLTLYVTEVRVQRLQDISEADAIAEGIERADDFFGCSCWKCYGDDAEAVAPDDPRGSYESLWDSINGPGSWAENPFVAAYTFTPRLGNIDSLPATLMEEA